MKQVLIALFVCACVAIAAGQTASPPTTFYYPPVSSGTVVFPQVWNASACDLTISYQIDMSGYVPPMWNTAWFSVGVTGGAVGWVSSGAPAAAETNPVSLDNDDKHNLGAPARYDESSYDVIGPQLGGTIVTPPIGSPGSNFGVWFDRDGVDQWQAAMWGMINGKTYNTGGVYDIVVNYHQQSPGLGTMFNTVNEQPTGFYNTWKNAAPDFYPVGKTITGDLTNLQVSVSGLVAPVTVSEITVTGCLVLEEGMATGGGWFIPEADKATGLVNLGQRASFGFVAKLKNGLSTGNLQFQYHGDGLDLTSDSYDWVALSSTQVIFEGTGVLNGVPGYRFRVRAVDGNLLGGGVTDRFEIRIWTGTDIWDAPTYRAEGNLGGGQIVVHKN